MPGTHRHVILNIADSLTWLCFCVKGELQKISPEQAVETLVEYPSEDETIGRSTRPKLFKLTRIPINKNFVSAQTDLHGSRCIISAQAQFIILLLNTIFINLWSILSITIWPFGLTAYILIWRLDQAAVIFLFIYLKAMIIPMMTQLTIKQL